MFRERNVLGKKLQQLRRLSGLSEEEVATRMSYSQAGVSRLENSRLKPSHDLVQKYCDALGITGKVKSELLELTDLFLYTFDRWAVGEEGFARLQELAQKKSKSCKHLRSFEWNLVFGLLQTRDYATSLFQLGSPANQAEVQKTVDLRMSGQSVLREPTKRIQLVISEKALYNQIVSREAMLAQLIRLEEALHLEHAEFRVLPQDSQLTAVPINSFSIFDESCVSIEGYTGVFYLWDKTEVDHYITVFDKLYVLAVGGSRAKQIIQGAIEHYRRGTGY